MSTSGLDRQLAEAAGQPEGHIARSFMGTPSAEQLNLLRDEKGELPPNVFALARQQGRPPGATNKRSQSLAKYIVEKYGDPADALGNVMSMDWGTLRELFRQAQGGEAKHKPVRMVDVAKFWLDCTRELMDRVHGKPTQKLEVDAKVEGVIFAPSLLPQGSSQAIEHFTSKLLAAGVTAEDIRELESEIQEAEFVEVDDAG